jgi:hypothetical protein
VPTLLGQLLPLFADTEEAVVKAAWTATGLVMTQIPKVKKKAYSHTPLAHLTRFAPPPRDLTFRLQQRLRGAERAASNHGDD